MIISFEFYNINKPLLFVNSYYYFAFKGIDCNPLMMTYHYLFAPTKLLFAVNN